MCNKTNDIRDFDSFYELIEYFSTEEICVDYLARIRWNGNVTCPHCGNDHAYELNIKGRSKHWRWSGCQKKFSVRVGTIFENSKIPLRKWFFALYLFSAHKKGVSSHQLARDLKLTQKMAWFIIRRLRKSCEPTKKIFTGVEIDETYVGGKESNKHASKRTWRKSSNKTNVTKRNKFRTFVNEQAPLNEAGLGLKNRFTLMALAYEASLTSDSNYFSKHLFLLAF